jgi:hypothetical protein
MRPGSGATCRNPMLGQRESSRLLRQKDMAPQGIGQQVWKSARDDAFKRNRQDLYKSSIQTTSGACSKTLWPSGLGRRLKAPFRKSVGSNPAGVILTFFKVVRPHCAPSGHTRPPLTAGNRARNLAARSHVTGILCDLGDQDPVRLFGWFNWQGNPLRNPCQLNQCDRAPARPP